MNKLICLVLSMTLVSSQVFAHTKLATREFKDSVDDFLYSVQVEWDQTDIKVYKDAENKLLEELKTALNSGQQPEQLARELIEKIPDPNQRQEFHTLLKSQHAHEVIETLLTQHHNSLGFQGASWSPGKVLLGMVLTYAVLKGLMLIIYYWDSIGYEGGDDSTPPPPPKTLYPIPHKKIFGINTLNLSLNLID